MKDWSKLDTARKELCGYTPTGNELTTASYGEHYKLGETASRRHIAVLLKQGKIRLLGFDKRHRGYYEVVK